MEQGFFITGTDTNVGKTFAAVTLMRCFQQQGKSVIGMKPVASGCTVGEEGLRNEDALLLQAHSSIQLDYDLINPYAFELPVSPHIAAREAGQEVELSVINEAFKKLSEMAQVVLVEGVGGWLVPLGKSVDVAGMAMVLKLPIILVVAIRLGCINQARLSFAAIKSSGLPCAGWIANCMLEETLKQQENIETITQLLEAPLLGVIPYSTDVVGDSFSKNFIELQKMDTFLT